MAADGSCGADIALIGERRWAEARRRATMLGGLGEGKPWRRSDVRAVAADLGLSERQVWRLVRRWRASGGDPVALLSTSPSGGRGVSRLPAASEELLSAVIREVYLTPQRLSPQRTTEEVRRCFLARGLRPPSPSTVRRRLRSLTVGECRRRGEGREPTRPITGATPEVAGPLDLVQVDHTKVDLILVDPFDREPIGRPWLTVAIDVHSRCIAGFHLSLEPPSAASVGLCLTHAASEKTPWLEARGVVSARWPIAGKPRRLGVDNGREFHSLAFERGCERHGIAIDWRPPGQPHYGGVVERVIGTLMGLVHALPGTTFSNVAERGRYDSDKAAALTLEELERWLGVAITKHYHLRSHEGLAGEAPLSRFEAGVEALAAAGRTVPVPRQARAYLVDFLPLLRRTLRRSGIVVDHITYYSHALKPWIQAAGDRAPTVTIRRDPRDLSRIFTLDTEDGGYLEVPYRTVARPAISLWEHRSALRRLRARRAAAIDEAALFAAIEEMRAIEDGARRATRSARRNKARRQELRLVAETTAPRPGQPVARHTLTALAAPPPSIFDVEEW